MNSRPLAQLSVALVLASVSGAVGQQVDELQADPRPTPIRWTVTGSLEGANDLSGLACVPAPDRNNCLLGSDELRSVQCFQLLAASDQAGPRLVAGRSVELFASGDELDTEGIAYADGHYYVVGSHALSRKSRLQPNRFHVVRIDADVCDASSRAYGRAEDNTVRNTLSDVIEASDELSPYLRRSLAANGVNIEAVAVIDDRAYFGFRSPNLDGRAPILSMPLAALFPADSSSPAAPKRGRLDWIELGEDTGIRDLAAVSGGLLLLTGNSSIAGDPKTASDSRAAIQFWDRATARPRLLAKLPETATKPEGLLLLDETGAHYRVLIVADTAANGTPTEYSVAKDGTR